MVHGLAALAREEVPGRFVVLEGGIDRRGTICLQAPELVVLARKGLAFGARGLVVRKKLVELVALVFELARFDVAAVSSLFHGSAPMGWG